MDVFENDLFYDSKDFQFLNATGIPNPLISNIKQTYKITNDVSILNSNIFKLQGLKKNYTETLENLKRAKKIAIATNKSLDAQITMYEEAISFINSYIDEHLAYKNTLTGRTQTQSSLLGAGITKANILASTLGTITTGGTATGGTTTGGTATGGTTTGGTATGGTATGGTTTGGTTTGGTTTGGTTTGGTTTGAGAFGGGGFRPIGGFGLGGSSSGAVSEESGKEEIKKKSNKNLLLYGGIGALLLIVLFLKRNGRNN